MQLQCQWYKWIKHNAASSCRCCVCTSSHFLCVQAMVRDQEGRVKRLHWKLGTFLTLLQIHTIPGCTCVWTDRSHSSETLRGTAEVPAGPDTPVLSLLPLHTASDAGVTFLTEVTAGSALSHSCSGHFKNFYCALSLVLPRFGQWGRHREECMDH